MFVWAVTIQSLKWHQGQEEFRYQVQDSRLLSTSNHKPLLSYSFVYKAEEFHFYLLCECDMGFSASPDVKEKQNAAFKT